MLKLLLDEPISPAVAAGMRRRDKTLNICGMAAWENGSFLGQADEMCLRQASAQRLTLVTCDRRTIPPLLKNWAEQGLRHGGVIFVDEKTISPSHIGGLVQALTILAKEARDWNWTDRVCFLRR